MSTASIPGGQPLRASGVRRLWRRDLDQYPTGGYRIFLLAIVVVANIIFTWTVAAGTAATTGGRCCTSTRSSARSRSTCS